MERIERAIVTEREAAARDRVERWATLLILSGLGLVLVSLVLSAIGAV